MKTISTISFLSFILLTAGSFASNHKSSTGFEKIKSLAGTWEGTVDHGTGPMQMTVVYEITAGGSAVQETIFPGTEEEMVTLYYNKGGKLGLTHYCMLQNRPEMILKSSSKKKLIMEFDPSCEIDPKTESHMNSVTFIFEGKNKMIQDWAFFENGEKQDHGKPFELTRVDP